MLNKLKFAKGNAKLGKATAIFSLPAGHTCPGALLCMSRANEHTGKLTDGPKNVFRCYAASGENLFRNIRVSRWRNFRALLKAKTIEAMASMIERSMPRKGIKLCRIHSSGDFFSQAYFDAWLLVASRKPEIVFYAYTKALNFWIARLGKLPSNMRLVASRGGRFDTLIEQYKLRCVTVVGTNPMLLPELEAKQLGLKIDHDDTLAWKTKDNFALSLHGTQPAGTPAAKAWQHIRIHGQGGYKTNYFDHYAKQDSIRQIAVAGQG